MTTDQAIAQLTALAIEPSIKKALIERIQKEGLTDAVRADVVQTVEDALTVFHIERAAMHEALEVTDQAISDIQRIETKAKQDFDEIQADTLSEMDEIVRNAKGNESVLESISHSWSENDATANKDKVPAVVASVSVINAPSSSVPTSPVAVEPVAASSEPAPAVDWLALVNELDTAPANTPTSTPIPSTQAPPAPLAPLAAVPPTSTAGSSPASLTAASH